MEAVEWTMQKQPFWSCVLEKDFNNAFFELDQIIGEYEHYPGDLAYRGNQKMEVMNHTFAQLLHKTRVMQQALNHQGQQMKQMHADLRKMRLRATQKDKAVLRLMSQIRNLEGQLDHFYVALPQDIGYNGRHSTEHGNSEQMEQVAEQAKEDFSSIYHEYVSGTPDGHSNETYGKIKSVNIQNNNKENENVPNDNQSEQEQSSEMPILNPVVMNVVGPTAKETQQIIQNGYEIPLLENRTLIPFFLANENESVEKPYACSLCSYRSRDKGGVTKHIRAVHTFETPFECPYCPKAFKQNSNLKRHIRSHLAIKPYACKECGKSYSDKKNIDAHIYREHLNVDIIICNVENCRKKFWRHDRYAYHCLNEHGAVPSSV